MFGDQHCASTNLDQDELPIKIGLNQDQGFIPLVRDKYPSDQSEGSDDDALFEKKSMFEKLSRTQKKLTKEQLTRKEEKERKQSAQNNDA